MKVYIAKVQSSASKLYKRLSIRVKEANESQMFTGQQKTEGELQLEQISSLYGKIYKIIEPILYEEIISNGSLVSKSDKERI